MTPKPIQVRKMIALMVLYLLRTTVIAKSSENSLASSSTGFNSNHHSHKEITPEKLNGHNFAVADLDKNLSLMPRPVQINDLSIKSVGLRSNSMISKCFVPFKQVPTIPMRRLSHKMALLATYANDMDSQQRMKLVLVNTTNCNYAYAHDSTLQQTKWIFLSNRSLNESFSVIQHGKKICGGHNWCRLFFDPFYYKSEPLDFDFPKHWLLDIRPIVSFDGNLFALELLDDTMTYRVRLYNVTNNSAKELFSLERFFVNGWMSRYEVRSSSLSYCWRTSEGAYEDKTVHCSSFREDGTALFNETIVYPHFMQFLNLRSIPNGLILISTSPDSCFRKICLPVQATVLTKDLKSFNSNDSISVLHSTLASRENDLIEINHPEYHFECRPRRMNLSDDVSEIDYMYCAYRYTNRHRTHIITYVV